MTKNVHSAFVKVTELHILYKFHLFNLELYLMI